MLRQRVVTALLLLPPVLAVILFAPVWLFDAVVAAALLLLALEYAGLCGMKAGGRAFFVALTLLLFAAAAFPWNGAALTGRVLLAGALLSWLVALLWLFRRDALPAGLKALPGALMLAGAGVALHGLKLAAADGRWIFMAFVLVWAADVGGYAFGRLFGRRKLAPAISPGKTWEGVAGGVVLVLLVGAIAAPAFMASRYWLAWLLLLLLLAAVSVIGDLYESLLKRQAGVKDSGQLLPGHGGLLDRLDSLLAVAPVFLVAGSRIGIFGELSPWGL